MHESMWVVVIYAPACTQHSIFPAGEQVLEGEEESEDQIIGQK